MAEIDTSHFMGNFPESIELHAQHNTNMLSEDLPSVDWTEILPRTKVGPHRRHYFQLENVQGKAYTHVKVTIHPDGGLKRVRLIGKRADQPVQSSTVANGKGANNVSGTNVFNEANEVPKGPPSADAVSGRRSVKIIPILPLTPEAFAPFGRVVQAYADHNAAPLGTKITPANQGTAIKFHKLALLDSSSLLDAGATTGLSVYRSDPLPGGGKNGEWEVNVLERHPFTTQGFIPMGTAGSFGQNGDGLEDPGDGYLVVVAKDASDGKPDLKTLRAFVASAAQGIVYKTAVWRECLLSYLVEKCGTNPQQYRSADGRLWQSKSFSGLIINGWFIGFVKSSPWTSHAWRLRLAMAI